MAEFEPLELEESELFDVQADTALAIHSKGGSPTAMHIHDPDNNSSDAEESTGLVLDDFDEMGSTASAERGILTSSTATTTTTTMMKVPDREDKTVGQADAASSHGAHSNVGSLKRFDSFGSGLLRPLYGSEGDLALGASAPVRSTGIAMPSRSITPGPHLHDVTNHTAAAAAFAAAVNANANNGQYLGTSMPIRIPMRRTLSGNSPASLEGRRAGFVPPHLIGEQQQATMAELVAQGGASSLALSPSAAVKREKLIARNAILRSTGFIEIQRPLAAAPVGEVIDVVRESALEGEGIKRHRPTSSLSALLSSSS